VLIRTHGSRLEYIDLIEGIPLRSEIKIGQIGYFNFNVYNPKATKVTVQLTTLHGDPNLFV
jgi:hypothetical protein